jgi:hypothetical protein
MSVGKRSKKIGRGQRKKSRIRYIAENRSETNKARRIAKQKKFEEKKKLQKERREEERLKAKTETAKDGIIKPIEADFEGE